MHLHPPRVHPGTLTAVFLLVSLAGCGLTEEDTRVCAGIVCSAGYCLAESGQPVCHCGPLEWSLGQTCALQREETPTEDTDNTPPSATPLEPSSVPRTFTFARLPRPKQDVDYFAFQAVAGHIYRVSCKAPGGCEVSVQDGILRTLAVSAHRQGAPLHIELTSPGQYFLHAVSFTSEGGEYSLLLEDLGLDDVGDDEASAAPRLPSPESFSGLLETPGDADVFALQTTPATATASPAPARRRRRTGG